MQGLVTPKYEVILISYGQLKLAAISWLVAHVNLLSFEEEEEPVVDLKDAQDDHCDVYVGEPLYIEGLLFKEEFDLEDYGIYGGQ